MEEPIYEEEKIISEDIEKLRRSIGWIEPETVKWERKDSNETMEGVEWDVYMGEGATFTCEEQEHAEILSYLVQINEIMKRIEKKLEKL